jgi:hypothetical protein
MPGDDAHPLGMSLQDHHRLLQCGYQAILGYLPHLVNDIAQIMGQTIHWEGCSNPKATSTFAAD